MTAFVSTTITTTGYGSLVLPGYVTKVIIECWGAGGGGTASGGTGGGGGGGGAYGRANLYVAGGETLFYFVGRGGIGATNALTAGNGQATWVTLSSNAQPTVIGNYGTGAGMYANGGGGGITAGSIAWGGNSWIFSDVAWAGGIGGAGSATGGAGSRGGGGGGGGAGSASAGGTGGNGGNGTAGARGAPGTTDTFTDTFQEVNLSNSTGAFGGNGVVTTGNGISGLSPGGGGGGGYNTTGIYGGNGGDGKIVISYNQRWSPTST